MTAGVQKRILETIDKIIMHGRTALAQGRLTPQFVNEAHKFIAQGKSLVSLLGPDAAIHRDVFDPKIVGHGPVQAMVGTLEGLKISIEQGLLQRMENFILADTFGNLLDQAKYLFDAKYFLAAGVIGRAVLESHLLKWCQRENCLPTKTRPTIEDYKSALYANNHLSKTEMKHVESMAAVGNDAAHANPSLTPEQVERVLEGLTEFLANHPLP